MPDNTLRQCSLDVFLDDLASSKPTPGGGAVAALTAALAAGLGRMACAFTLGKSRFADVEDQVRRLNDRLRAADDELRPLIDADADAYATLNTAFKLPKHDPDRPARIAAAARTAADVPMQTARLAREVDRCLAALHPIGNPNLRSDVSAAQHLAAAAIEAAAENVRANLPFLDDDTRKRYAEDLAEIAGVPRNS